MEPLNVVLYQHDAGTAQALAANLSQHFPSVYTTRNREEIRPAIARLRAEALVLDVEAFRSGEVERLHKEFPSLCIVCTHRLADEELWADALNQGAADLCDPSRTEEIVQSVLRERAHRAAA